MSNSASQAKALLDVALETYAQEIMPALPGDKRYTGAMVANALGIAARRLGSPGTTRALLEATGAQTIEALAKSIRAGAVSGQAHEGLAGRLLDYLEAELAITNPKFLERRKG